MKCLAESNPTVSTHSQQPFDQVVKELDEVSFALLMISIILLHSFCYKFNELTYHLQFINIQAENELRKSQEEFDRQIEIVSAICNKILKSNEQHVKYLSKFIEAQAEYYENANKHLKDLLENKSDSPTDSASQQQANSTGFATFAAFSEASPE